MQNENIILAKQKLLKALYIIIAIQICSLLFTFSKTILIVWIPLCIIFDIAFYKLRIKKLNNLLSINPKDCVVEDFIVVYTSVRSSSASKRRREYLIYPVLKDLITNDLYFTCDLYSLAHYSKNLSIKNNKIDYIEILRKDGSVLKIGDNVKVYINRILNLTPYFSVGNNDTWFKIKKSNFFSRYHIIDKQYDIYNFDKFTYFEGYVDINV